MLNKLSKEICRFHSHLCLDEEREAHLGEWVKRLSGLFEESLISLEILQTVVSVVKQPSFFFKDY